MPYTRTRTAALVGVVALALAGAALAAAPPAKPPTFMTWSATINSTATTASGTQTSAGVAAYDAVSNRSAWVSDRAPFVADFSTQMAYFLDGQQNCQYTCQLDGDTICESQLDGNALCGYDMTHYGKYVDTVTLPSGVQAWHYHWDDPLGPISMAGHDMFTSTTSPATVLRYGAQFHPFGQSVMNVTSDYTNWSTDTPAEKYFTVNGQASCQDGGDTCQNDVRRVVGHLLSMQAMGGK